MSSRSSIHRFGRQGEIGLSAVMGVLLVIVMVMATIGIFSTMSSTMSTMQGASNGTVSEASYIIFVDDSGSTCAKNGTTGRIDARSTNSSEVIQYAADHALGLINVNAGEYSISYTVSVRSNTYFSAVGAVFNLTELNTYAFIFNPTSKWVNYRYFQQTGMEGASFIGDIHNSGCWVAKANWIVLGLKFDNIRTNNVANGINVNSSAFGGIISNFQCWWFNGTGVLISNNTPNGITISSCNFERGYGNSVGVNISSSGDLYYTEETRIQNCWFEEVTHCIITNGYHTTIDKCKILPTNEVGSFGIKIYKGTLSSHSGDSAAITGCTFLSQANNNASIIMASPYQTVKVIGNTFAVGYSRVFYSAVEVSLIFTSNSVSMVLPLVNALEIHSSRSVISQNTFSVRNTSIYFLHSSWDVVSSNKFENNLRGIYHIQYGSATGNVFLQTTPGTDFISGSYTEFSGNFLYGSSNVTLSHSQVSNNYGYNTSNHGDAHMLNGTSSLVIYHHLSGYPWTVHVTGSTSQTGFLTVTNRNEKCFTIDCWSSIGVREYVTADQDVYWTAEVRNGDQV